MPGKLAEQRTSIALRETFLVGHDVRQSAQPPCGRACNWATSVFIGLFVALPEAPPLRLSIPSAFLFGPFVAYALMLLLTGAPALLASPFQRSRLPTALWGLGHFGAVVTAMAWGFGRAYMVSECRQAPILACGGDPHCRVLEAPACNGFEIVAEWARSSPAVAAAVAVLGGMFALWAAWSWRWGRWGRRQPGQWVPWLTAALVMWLLVSPELRGQSDAAFPTIVLAMMALVILCFLGLAHGHGIVAVGAAAQATLVYLAALWHDDRLATLRHCRMRSGPCGLAETIAAATGLVGW